MVEVMVDELAECDDHAGEPDVVVLVGGRADVGDGASVWQITSEG